MALIGPNGAGKTNLLEAISLLVPGRGLRNAAYAEDLMRHGSAGWAVAADDRRPPEGRIAAGTAWRPRPGGRGRPSQRLV